MMVRPVVISSSFVRWLGQRDRLWIWLMLIVTVLAYCVSHASTGLKPRAADMSGWWQWHDQGKYVIAARAWASLDLTPTAHWYFPGYAILGAFFTRLTPIDPFYIPNLACLLGYGCLFVVLAELLLPDFRYRRPAAVLTFLATTPLSPLMLRSYVQPWNTSPTSVIALASLVAAIRFSEHPKKERAFTLGVVVLSTALFRPTEALILAAVIAPFAGYAILTMQGSARDRFQIAAAGVLGALMPLLLFGVIYTAIYGWQESDYIAQSRKIGFEWRLLPLRWVLLFVCPRPLFEDRDAYALIEVFPWVGAGVAGMMGCLNAANGPQLRRHTFVISAIVVHCAVFLTYRDIHPQGLIRYGNYHYFKWLIPLFGLYAVLLVVLVKSSPRRVRAWALSAIATVLLFGWRPVWIDSGSSSDDAHFASPHEIVLSRSFRSINEGLRLTTSASFRAVYWSDVILESASGTFAGNTDLKSFPIDGGLIFTALRPLPAEPSRVIFKNGVELDVAREPRWGFQTVQPGFPQWHASVNRHVIAWWEKHFGR